jgi:hypothetical protein
MAACGHLRLHWCLAGADLELQRALLHALQQLHIMYRLS